MALLENAVIVNQLTNTSAFFSFLFLFLHISKVQKSITGLKSQSLDFRMSKLYTTVYRLQCARKKSLNYLYIYINRGLKGQFGNAFSFHVYC